MTKRTYVKPKVIYRSMDLSSHIAAGCALGPTFEEFSCPVDVPEWGISVFGESNCEYSTPDDNDMVCYHVPFADGNIFTS